MKSIILFLIKCHLTIYERDNTIEERKAECFVAIMLLKGVDRYFIELLEMDFVSKIFHCMSAFQVPYKALLVSLYEYAIQSENETLEKRVKEVFDLEFENVPQKFQELGLDDSLVKPSYVINALPLQERIRRSKIINPEINYHKDNEEFLINIMKEISMITGKGE